MFENLSACSSPTWEMGDLQLGACGAVWDLNFGVGRDSGMRDAWRIGRNLCSSKLHMGSKHFRHTHRHDHFPNQGHFRRGRYHRELRLGTVGPHGAPTKSMNIRLPLCSIQETISEWWGLVAHHIMIRCCSLLKLLVSLVFDEVWLVKLRTQHN